MTQFHSAHALRTPGAPVAVRLQGLTIGFAIHEARGVRFLAGHWRFDALDRRRFDSLGDIHAAASKIATPDRLTAILRPRSPIREREWELEETVV